MVGVVDAGAVAFDGGVDAVVVGAGTVVVWAGDVAAGLSGKRWVRDGGCPVRVAPPAGDVETLAAASRTLTAMPVVQPTDGNRLQFAVIHCHARQKNPPGRRRHPHHPGTLSDLTVQCKQEHCKVQALDPPIGV